MEEAGKTAADVEAQMRTRDRKSGFKIDDVDEQEIEEYYRNRSERCKDDHHHHLDAP